MSIPRPVPLTVSQKEKLTAEEAIKRSEHPFDALGRLHGNARTDAEPAKDDIFRFKWNGLFWLAPVHEGYMCRLRIPGGQVSAAQVRELASIADGIASGYLQITTRNNFQIRVIKPNEFFDLPRKFNVSYDGGGMVGVAEDTNDIGLRAVKLKTPPEGHPLHGRIEAGVHFQLLLGGVTGHGEFAEHCGALCRPEDATDVVAALTRVFIRHGSRANRGKSRMIYLVKEWGFEKYLSEAEALLGWKLPRYQPGNADDELLFEPHEKPAEPHPQIGSYPQKQAGLGYLGVYVPVGILQTDEARAIAEVADEFGSGELRLTIFQNVIIPNIPDPLIDAAKAKLAEAGLRCDASFVRGGVAACTGNRYCKYASSDTKGHAMEAIDYLEHRITLDQPVNIHVTGCPHSCAQHYIGDIGLLACKVKTDDSDDPVEGYHVFVGGSFGDDDKRLGRQLFKSLPAGPALYERLHAILAAYLTHREGDETFLDFTSRHDIEQLAGMTHATLRLLQCSEFPPTRESA